MTELTKSRGERDERAQVAFGAPTLDADAHQRSNIHGDDTARHARALIGVRSSERAMLALGGIIAAPIVVDVVIYVGYLASYSGMCDAHPTDIPARACDLPTYAGDFFGDAFAIVGLMMIDFAVLGLATLVAIALAIAYKMRAWLGGSSASRAR